MGTSYRRIEAVRVSVGILRHLSEQKGPIGSQDISRAIDMPHGTVMCHLATMEDEGLVRCVGGAWELGLGLSLFWARYKSKAEDQIHRLQSELQQLGAN